MWFNASGYGLDKYGLDIGQDHGVHTYTSFNYLNSIADLAGYAAKQCRHGDVVLLMFKFVHAGNYNATRLSPNSDMANDITSASKTSGEKPLSESLMILLESLPIQELSEWYTQLQTV